MNFYDCFTGLLFGFVLFVIVPIVIDRYRDPYLIPARGNWDTYVTTSTYCVTRDYFIHPRTDEWIEWCDVIYNPLKQHMVRALNDTGLSFVPSTVMPYPKIRLISMLRVPHNPCSCMILTSENKKKILNLPTITWRSGVGLWNPPLNDSSCKRYGLCFEDSTDNYVIAQYLDTGWTPSIIQVIYYDDNMQWQSEIFRGNESASIYKCVQLLNKDKNLMKITDGEEFFLWMMFTFISFIVSIVCHVILTKIKRTRFSYFFEFNILFPAVLFCSLIFFPRLGSEFPFLLRKVVL